MITKGWNGVVQWFRFQKLVLNFPEGNEIALAKELDRDFGNQLERLATATEIAATFILPTTHYFARSREVRSIRP